MSTEKPLPDVMYEIKPPKAHDYCQVCKDTFVNYFQHIDSQKHKNFAKLNKDLFEQVDVWMKDVNTKFKQRYQNKKLTEFAEIVKMVQETPIEEEHKISPSGKRSARKVVIVEEKGAKEKNEKLD